MLMVSFFGENSEPLLCRLEDGVVFNSGRTMLMLHGDPLMKRVNEIINGVVEAGLYEYWISLSMVRHKYYLGRYLSFTHLMDITASISIICNLPSISL